MLLLSHFELSIVECRFTNIVPMWIKPWRGTWAVYYNYIFKMELFNRVNRLFNQHKICKKASFVFPYVCDFLLVYEFCDHYCTHEMVLTLSVWKSKWSLEMRFLCDKTVTDKILNKRATSKGWCFLGDFSVVSCSTFSEVR